MHIAVVHQFYLMPGMPGGSRFNELARLWREAGHRVTVIAGNVDYNSGTTPQPYAAVWAKPADEDGTTVYRCHVPQTYGRSYVGRMWAFFGFTLSATCAALCIDAPHVVIATSPPLIAAIPGFIASVRHRAPWVFEIRDLWPESAVTTGVLKASSPLTKLLYALEAWGYGAADRINVLTPAFRDDIVGRKLAGDGKIIFVPNGADVDMFAPTAADQMLRKSLGWDGKTVVMYAGAHGRANALDQLVNAAERLRHRQDILIACVGDGPMRRELESSVKERGLTNIVFHGPQPKERMPALVNACDIGAAVLQHNPTFRTVYPNKVFDYMACEKPTLLAIDGVAKELICDQAKAGIFAEPENAGAIADAIVALVDDAGLRAKLGSSGRMWVVENATRDALAERYADHLQSLVDEQRTPARRARRSRLKRVIDISVATTALALTAPIFGATAAAVRWKLGTPVLFRQQRPGLDGRPFEMLKLRTMAHPAPGMDGPEHDAARLGKLGQLLRATSIDELPTLLNVLKGDMSLVGPRPLLMHYLPLYSRTQSRRHTVKPGITGWAQVNGRNMISWARKFDLDVWYADNWSLALDLKILARTAFKVLRREGIEAEGHATMPPFRGNDDATDAA